ncbi:MAG TPA: hypothetical protein VFU74_06070 [Actinocrinis sp.]|nr:hypothetical protein [Actinocrinis sp.]
MADSEDDPEPAPSRDDRANERWRHTPLGFVYKMFEDKQAFTNLMQFLGAPVIQTLILATAAALLAICAAVAATLAHQTVPIRWMAAGSAGGGSVALFGLRILFRWLKLRRAANVETAIALDGQLDDDSVGEAKEPSRS